MPDPTPDAVQRAVAIETSSPHGSLALTWDGDTHALELARGAHARDLLPALERALVRAGGRRPEGPLTLDAVFVGTGPGSYTGLRIGIASAKGLARGARAALHGVPSFEALAFGELAVNETCAVALDARAARFYYARYRREEGDVVALREPCLLARDELVRALADDERVLGLGDPARAARLEEPLAAPVAADCRPRAEALLALGRARLARGELERLRAVEPLYLRSFGER